MEPLKPQDWTALAKLSQDSFFNRRDVEWKTAIGLWTAIGAWTYFGVTNSDRLVDMPIDRLHQALWVIGGVLLVGWQLPLRQGFEDDKRWKHYYMHRAEGLVEPQPKSANYFTGLYQLRHLPWTFGQLAITLILLWASNAALKSAIEHAKSIPAAQSQQGTLGQVPKP